jgi:hypothetical protein
MKLEPSQELLQALNGMVMHEVHPEAVYRLVAGWVLEAAAERVDADALAVSQDDERVELYGWAKWIRDLKP